MTVTFNDDGSTRTVGGRPFKEYVHSVWEEDGEIDLDDFDPDDYEQIRAWVMVWESGEYGS